MSAIYFYDVPVYRMREDEYNASRDKALARLMAAIFPDGKVLRETRERVEQREYEKFGPWRFNEVIGYIRLHLLGTQIRGEYYSAERQRTPLSRKKVFTYRTHKLAPEVDIERPYTNEAIWTAIRQYLERCRKEVRRGRVVEDSLLVAIGPHVDWRTVLGFSSDAPHDEELLWLTRRAEEVAVAANRSADSR